MKKLSLYIMSVLTALLFWQVATAQYQNTKYGDGALYFNTTGLSNAAYGTNALRNNTTGSFNTGIGKGALLYNISGSQNSAFGTDALRDNTTGIKNTASGVYALRDNTTGKENTANGFASLLLNTNGNYNTANGNSTLEKNQTGSYNTASGYQALYSNYNGSYNIASGSKALYSNNSGSYNIALGGFALYSNTVGNYNTAIGYAALFYNTFGYYNTANGYFSLYNNTTGFQNTASGYYALHVNSTGKNNTATGVFSLFNNSTGINNTATGNYALRNNTTGSRNTAVGDSAGARYSYNYSTFVGYKTTTTVSGLTNVTVIGNGASASASNQVRIGNSSVTSIGGKVGWSTLSDGRYKKNIQEDVPGLTFINKLRAVTYTFDVEGIDRANGVNEQSSTEEATAKAAAIKEKHTGFVAQEVEETAKKLNYEFSGVDKPQNDKDLYGLRYSEFVVPLVKAVQELSKKAEALEKENKELKDRLDKLETLVTGNNLTNKNTSVNLSAAHLEQNRPNPTDGSTLIRYYLPSTSVNAKLVITDFRGIVIKTIALNSSGSGQISLHSGTLAAGAYTYTLYVQGKQADSKQMIVGR